ncbi:hypothetical protein F1559_003252 [Cyanidiococcus yangmingshanensis]|uniref:Uncharacterized protein n=1 Tax=Cyanidiococcus yangmingshanensis TaxID=2690220 RepID=A0A7J7IQ56_9RHOD|nr:hypothetical protein F1559_003252 [Cyanidiococcus yangmingshanensis]
MARLRIWSKRITYFAVFLLLAQNFWAIGGSSGHEQFSEPNDTRLGRTSREAWLGGVPLFDAPPAQKPQDRSSHSSRLVEGQVKAVVIVARHGDRAPQNYAPAYATGTRRNKYKRFPFDKTTWDVDYGELTALGMYQCYKFGRFLRKKYIEGHPENKLLRNRYNHEETHVRATDVDRTLVSAAAVMHGLYPAESAPSRDHRPYSQDRRYQIPGGFQYVPVHTRLYLDDRLLDGSGKGRCKLWDIVTKRILKSDIVYGELQRHVRLYEALPSLTNMSPVSFQNMKKKQQLALAATVRDVRVCQRSHMIPVNPWVSQFDDDLEEVTARLNSAKWDGSGLGSLVGGRLLQSIATRLETAIEADNGNMHVLARAKDECNRKGHDGDEIGNCYRKLVYYSAHDTTIFDVRSALGVSAVVEGVAPYLSHVIFELRRMGRKGDFRVFVYAGHYDSEPAPLHGPFCVGNFSCSASSFFAWVRNALPRNITEACERTDLASEILRRALGNGSVESGGTAAENSAGRDQIRRGGMLQWLLNHGPVIFAAIFITVLALPTVFRLWKRSAPLEYVPI